MPILTLTGVVTDSQFQQARCLALELGRKKKTVKVEVVELGQMQWLEWIEKERKEMRGKGRTHNATCLAMHSVEGYLGGAKDFIEWCQEAYDMAPTVDIKAAEKKAEERFKGYMEKTGNTFVYMDLKFGDSEETERMIFELNVKQTPKTSGNFLKLCCGDSKAEGKGCRLHYKDTPIHRVVRGGWFQGGDVKDGSGMGGASIYGKVFGDESFDIKFDRRGVLAMANDGRHTNASQFFVSLKPLPFLNEKKVAFGHLFQGNGVLEKLEKCSLENERPKPEVVIVDCGKV
ncbi:hypothetical protein AAMO2058_000971300 [Amorphochlora amoebiformis]